MKKKMKKIIAKITVLVLLVAMLIPYTTIPKVEAAETCENGEWEYHTNYYFFVQTHTPDGWAWDLSRLEEGEAEDKASDLDETGNTYYTSFLYNFPSDGSTMEITSADFVNITSSGGTDDNNSTTEWSAKAFYNELLNMRDDKTYESIKPGSTYAEYSFNVKGKGATESDSIITYSLHGPWAYVSNGEKIEPSGKELNILDEKGTISMQSYVNAGNSKDKKTLLDDLVNATIYPQSENITISTDGLRVVGSSHDTNITNIKNAIIKFNETKGKYLDSTIGKATDKSDKVSENMAMSLYIYRRYVTSDIFKDEIQHIRHNNEYYYFNTNENLTYKKASDTETSTISSDSRLYFPDANYDEITEKCGEKFGVTTSSSCTPNKYITLGSKDGKQVSKASAIKLYNDDDDEKKINEYYFVAPSLFQISYKVCKASAEATTDKVTLSYKGNEPAGTASNIPESLTQDKGTEFKVSEKVPTLSGYTFKEWNLSEKCNSTSYEPGAKLGVLENNTTLFACWGDTTEGKQEKTGVLTYAGLFTGIMALAGGSYYIMKKKNVFKKI